jgi:hypothetical protein
VQTEITYLVIKSRRRSLIECGPEVTSRNRERPVFFGK